MKTGNKDAQCTECNRLHTHIKTEDKENVAVTQKTKDNTIKRMDLVNMLKGQQSYRDEKCQLKATHGPSMNIEKTHSTGRAAVGLKPILYTCTCTAKYMQLPLYILAT